MPSLVLAAAILFLHLPTAALSSSLACDTTVAYRAASVNTTLSALRAKGYDVAEGKFEVFNSTGFGANPSNPYVTYKFGLHKLGDLPVFKFDPRAALLFVGCTPSGVRYFSWRSYLMTEGASLVFASLGDSLNNLVIKTTGNGTAFGRTAAVVTTGDSGTLKDVNDALTLAGLGDVVNLDAYDPTIIPEGLISSRFIMLHRASVWSNADEKKAYFAQERSVYMVTPPKSTAALPLPPVPVRHRGSGTREQDLIPNFEAALAALTEGVRRYFTNATSGPGNGTVRHLLNTSITVNRALYGLDCIKSKSDCLGDNHDTNYIHSDRAPLASTDAYVFVGTNCVRNTKCTYSNIGIYKGALTTTPLAVNYRKMDGSAAYYAPSLDPAVADQLFAYAIMRSCPEGNPFCLEIGTDIVKSPSHGGDWFAIYRTYLEPSTRTGPLVTELVLPQLMHFGVKV